MSDREETEIDIIVSQTDLRCMSAQITDRILIESILATVISCTTALLHISGQDTIIVMDTGCAFFRHMSIDIFTMV